jgi:hypothetical protein
MQADSRGNPGFTEILDAATSHVVGVEDEKSSATERRRSNSEGRFAELSKPVLHLPIVTSAEAGIVVID